MASKPPKRMAESAVRILDSAEKLFSWRGFHGVSLRDIVGDANVQLALCYYHFGSKEDLFSAVLRRRAVDHAQNIDTALEQALLVEGTRRERREAIIRAFVTPIAERSLNGGEGWKNYIRLLAFAANHPQEEEYISSFRVNFDAPILKFVDVLGALHPEMDKLDVHWGFFFYQAAITHILVESGMLHRQSGGALTSTDLSVMVERVVPFISAGFVGLGATD